MNEDRDYLDLSQIPAHLQGLRHLEHKARWRLNDALAGAGVDTPADDLFVNSDDGQGVVIDHVSLVDMVVRAVQDGEAPRASAPFSGLFYVRASFDDAHRADAALPLSEAVAMAAAVYAQLQG
ncbi:hypothetical protein [Pseudomonas sp.]|uniref:hypothetical protein n=1 Tax=Pseudomonas sp. TaxID=306 RepID=UPI0028A96C93|nr:hypothetical protein [Pseudomonas sp.]